MCSNLSNHPRLGVFLRLLLRSFPGFPYIYEDTRRYINIYNSVYMQCVPVYWWKNTNFLCPAEVTLYEVYVGREEVEQTFPSVFSWLSTLVVPTTGCKHTWCFRRAGGGSQAGVLPAESRQKIRHTSNLLKARLSQKYNS